jgi:hypothetical protein
MATLFIGAKQYSIPSWYLQKYPLFEHRFIFEELRLPDFPEDIGHTLVHFLYTGAYETIDSPLGEGTSYVEREYQRSVQVYYACRMCGLPDLKALAEKHIEYFGKALTTVKLMTLTQKAFFSLPEDEIWLPKYVKNVLEREYMPEKPKPNIHDIVNNGTSKKSGLFRTAVMAAVIDILYAQVQQCAKNHEGLLDSLELDGDTEPEHVAGSDPGTGEYVMWPEEPAAAEPEVEMNGPPAALEESAVHDYPGSFAQAPICDPDELKRSNTDDADQIPDRLSDGIPECPSECSVECPAEDHAPSSAWDAVAFRAKNVHMTGWTGVPDKPFPYLRRYDEPTPEEPTPDEPTPEEPIPDEPTPDEPTPDEPTPDEPTPEEPVAEPITNVATSDNPLVPSSDLYVNWKALSVMKKKKRTKKLRAKGLPIPDKNGIISINLT